MFSSFGLVGLFVVCLSACLSISMYVCMSVCLYMAVNIIKVQLIDQFSCNFQDRSGMVQETVWRN